MEKVQENGNYRDEFISLINNKDKSRNKGFIVFLQGAVDLSPIEALCFEQSWNKCLTARYSASGGHVLFPLIEQFLKDVKGPGGGRTSVKKAYVSGPPQSIGLFRPELAEPNWKTVRTNLNILTVEDVNAEGALGLIERFTSALESSLSTGDRLVLLCEISDLKEDATLEALGFTEEIQKFLYDIQPERFGIVLSGIPKSFEIPSFDNHIIFRVSETNYGKSAITPERNQPLANDEATGADHLQITSEVNALADSIAAIDMQPPLVVGVLGGWGSGKSFVLHLLKERLLKIRSEDVSDQNKRKSFPYIGHPYIVHFDAWTYAKSSLWASLMQNILVDLNHQISIEQLLSGIDENLLLGEKAGVWKLLQELSPQDFTQLSQTKIGKEAIKMLSNLEGAKLDPDVLWNKLRDLRSKEREKLTEAEKKLASKRLELAKADEQIQRDVDERVDRLARIASWKPFQDQLVGILGSALRKTFQQEIVKTKDPEADISLDKVFKAVRLWKKLWGGTSARTLAFLGFAALSAVAGILVQKATGYAGSALGGAAGVILAGLDALKAANSWLEARLEDFEKLTETAREKRAEVGQRFLEDARENSETRKLERQILSLEAEVEAHRREVGITARHETLVDFLQGRLDRGDYEKHLGLLHRVQQDVEELSKSLLSNRLWENEDSQKDGILFPRGKPRVILVIDDLDRCPPGRVVEVLEAVQLLVKTPLFVVLIAMDVRYITRALEKAYEGVLIRDGMPSGLDYIEKIVQIPYRVRPIAPEAIPGYLSSQVSVKSEKEQAGLELDRSGLLKASGKPATITSPGDVAGRVEEPLPIEVQEFDSSEMKLLETCTLEIEISPRSMKRLLNVYKLIKIIWYRMGEKEPESAIKQTMILLLTLSARYPAIMRRFLLELEISLLKQGNALKRTIRAFLNDTIKKWSEREGRSADWNGVSSLIREAKLLQPKITLGNVGLRNVQLVRSFSFIGELDIPKDPETHNLAVDMSPVEVQTVNRQDAKTN